MLEAPAYRRTYRAARGRSAAHQTAASAGLCFERKRRPLKQGERRGGTFAGVESEDQRHLPQPEVPTGPYFFGVESPATQGPRATGRRRCG